MSAVVHLTAQFSRLCTAGKRRNAMKVRAVPRLPTIPQDSITGSRADAGHAAGGASAHTQKTASRGGETDCTTHNVHILPLSRPRSISSRAHSQHSFPAPLLASLGRPGCRGGAFYSVSV